MKLKLVIREDTPVLRAARWLRSGVPPSLVRLLQGPTSCLTLPMPDPSKIRGPIELRLAPELVLAHRYALPAAARSQLADAITLFIETETPFSRDEVLVHAERLDRRADTTGATYQLRIVPKQALFAAIRAAGIVPARVVAIADATAPGRTDFWRAAFPGRWLRRWLTLLPVALALACGGTVIGLDRMRNEREVAALVELTASRLPQVQRLAEAVSQRRSALATHSELAALLAHASSSFNTLQRLRAVLPAEAELVRLVTTGGDTVLTVRSPQILAVAQQLSEVAPARVEGAITVDPTTGRELATIRMSVHQETAP